MLGESIYNNLDSINYQINHLGEPSTASSDKIGIRRIFKSGNLVWCYHPSLPIFVSF